MMSRDDEPPFGAQNSVDLTEDPDAVVDVDAISAIAG
jgi:hypothetical protein